MNPFVDKYKINYPIVLGTPEVVQQYGNFQFYPTTFAIDKEGNIAGMQIGMLSKEALEQKVKSLISVTMPEKVPPAQPSSTEQQVSVETKLSTDKIQVGSTARIAIQLKIEKDWHVNSHTPTFDYLIGTNIQSSAEKRIHPL